MVFYDVHRQLISLTELADHEAIIEYFQTPTNTTDLIEHLQTLLADEWHDRWIKSPKKRKATKKKKQNQRKSSKEDTPPYTESSKHPNQNKLTGSEPETCLQH